MQFDVRPTKNKMFADFSQSFHFTFLWINASSTLTLTTPSYWNNNQTSTCTLQKTKFTLVREVIKHEDASHNILDFLF